VIKVKIALYGKIIFHPICSYFWGLTTFLFKIYKGNTKQGIIIRISWFAICISAFFLFFSHHFTIAQNVVMSFFAAAGLVYFYYKFKTFRQRVNH